MNLGPYEIALIAGGFTIIGALLGAWIGYRNALNLYRITEFNKAASTFRAAFVDSIHTIKDSGLKPGDEGWYALLPKIYTATVEAELEKAKIIFEPYLPPKERTGFNSARVFGVRSIFLTLWKEGQILNVHKSYSEQSSELRRVPKP